MALTSQAGTALANWWLAYRPGGIPTGTVYNALVSDLAVGDYLVGTRAKVSATGATTSGNRALTLDRLGVAMGVSWPATQTVQIIR